jgi:hypothetical protein
MSKKKQEAPVVREGQVWADKDKRSQGRMLRVDMLTTHRGRRYFDKGDTPSYALCRTGFMHEGQFFAHSSSRSDVWIKLSRFLTGYRLVQDAPAGDAPQEETP